jgi:DNA polymerase III alpha subunit (gram-positive type)
MWNNIFAGSMLVEIYVCNDCGKVEFYTETGDDTETLPQKNCPKCDRKHDFDYPKCPFCKYSYFN